MTCRWRNLCALLCLASWFSVPGVASAQQAPKPDTRPVLEITQNTTLDPAKTYGRIVIKASGITIDGHGASVIGATAGDPKDYKDVGVSAEGVSKVTLKNLNVKGWQTALHVVDGSEWLVEDCNFSDNFHWPEYGWHWGQNDRSGGIVLERVNHSTVRKCKANRVWDALELLDSNDNVIEENNFSHASNTCVWMFTSCRNVIQKNDLSWGLRIAPGETHARDSAGMLIEAGSDNNRFLDNDITHGGDGVFIRALNGWVSRGNVLERNDASYAHNNCFEAQSPGNTYRHNKASHGSHGIWVGLSDETVLEDNEVCDNGNPEGKHNAGWIYPAATSEPRGGAGGIIIIGQLSHTVCRGNKCIGNHGAGIVLWADPDNPRKKIYHWVLDNNVVRDNRIGIYMHGLDWLDMGGNVLDNQEDNLVIAGVASNLVDHAGDPKITQPPKAMLDGPSVAAVGKPVVLDASKSTDPAGKKLVFRWCFDDGSPAERSPAVTHAFKAPGFYRVGVTVTNGRYSDLAYRDFRALDDIPEIGTEGQAADWGFEEMIRRDGLVWSAQSCMPVGPARGAPDAKTKVEFSDDKESFLSGKSSVLARITPSPNGSPITLVYPKSKKAGIPLAGKTYFVFWSKYINPIVHAGRGLFPTITLYKSDQEFAILRPAGDDPRNSPQIEDRVDWMYRAVPLCPPAGDKQWKIDGRLPDTVNWITIELEPMSSLPLRVWIDAMGFR